MNYPNQNYLNAQQIKTLLAITLEAGEIAMKHFKSPNLVVTQKIDNSFVSNADKEVSKFISEKLNQYFPEISIICEEGENHQVNGDIFWLIDPIDGTHDYIKGSPEFTVNIGLIKNTQPIFGIIYAPAFEDEAAYYTDEKGQVIKYFSKTNQQEILKNNSQKIDSNIKSKLRIITSRNTKEEDVKNYFQNNSNSINGLEDCYPEIIRLSSSLKFCHLVENKSDLYLHFRKSSEWDIAAGNALLLAMGGKVIEIESNEILGYNKKDFLNKSFIAKI